MMKISWLRFEWDLKKIPSDELRVPSPFILSRAQKDGRGALCVPKFGGFGGRWPPDFEVAQKLAA
jgi:hypothetical protein